jgi:hypothetical protein
MSAPPTEETPQLERWGKRILLPIAPGRYRELAGLMSTSRSYPEKDKREVERRRRQRERNEQRRPC